MGKLIMTCATAGSIVLLLGLVITGGACPVDSFNFRTEAGASSDVLV